MPLSILFVDDESDLCQVFSEIFSSEEVLVRTFVDPDQALKYSKAHPPDVVFLDYKLQYTTGDEIAFKMNAATPIYLISGLPVKETKYPFLKVLKKPFNEEEILQILSSLLTSVRRNPSPAAFSSAASMLKDGTALRHHEAESTDFIRSLVRSEASLQAYVTYLRALAIIHAVLEQTISTSNDPVLREIWQSDMKKLPLLEADIQALSPAVLSDLPKPIGIALKAAEQIRAWSLQNPLTLAGYLYVLEGSTNGGIHIFPRVSQAYGLKGDDGVRYLKNYEESQPAHWEAFKDRLNHAVTSEKDFSSVLNGANEVYDCLINILKSLSSANTEFRVHATAINPEAGSHKVPQHDVELKAVFLAAEVCLRDLPYVHARYGERGVRFTRSDGAWTVTLADLPEDVAIKQVQWLAKFLSSLGMPRFTLETHLLETERALKQLQPIGAEKYAILARAAELMRQSRYSTITRVAEVALSQKFDAALNVTERERYKNLSYILISAVVDERAYKSGALARTMNWIEQDSSWPDCVRQACQNLVSELNQSLASTEANL